MNCHCRIAKASRGTLPRGRDSNVVLILLYTNFSMFAISHDHAFATGTAGRDGLIFVAANPAILNNTTVDVLFVLGGRAIFSFFLRGGQL
jgi:hypothetical protein